jgi:hypothetical protein
MQIEASRRSHRAEHVARQRLEKLNQLDAEKASTLRVDAEATETAVLCALTAPSSDALDALELIRLQLKALSGMRALAGASFIQIVLGTNPHLLSVCVLLNTWIARGQKKRNQPCFVL